MAAKHMDDGPLLPQTVYDPKHDRTRPIVAMPGRVGSVRSGQSTIRSFRPGAHDSFRASYVPLNEPGSTNTSTHNFPTEPAQAAIPPLIFRNDASQAYDYNTSPSVVSFLNQNGVPQPKGPQQTNATVIGRCTYEVSLDRGYFNHFISSPTPKELEQHRGPSENTDKSPLIGDSKDIPENMSTKSSSRSLPSSDSNIVFMKGTSGFEKSEENLTLVRRARKTGLTTIFLAIVAMTFFLEECVMGAVWALLLSKRSNGASAFARGYFESKAMNFVGSAIGALVGLSVQWFLYPKLSRNRVALQLWSFVLIFLTYMGCCIAAGMAKRLEY
ncbi:uncharacterized protein BKCO1_15000117 [Diplodia corticola]|uniref:Uncharacterized protein n=1 Tax=Diplodia corticola TaxID=236234 RepID=A0A1J9RTF4_9PEZI|nr:uncharacterized protein BKCO1_15000117 [Diplodia corticola]OJD35835.1 hypothetical protein BKCO1_15000117 [Diplodia corticola]